MSNLHARGPHSGVRVVERAPRIREAAARLGEQARDASWTHEEYLAAVLSRELSAREKSGAELRIRAAPANCSGAAIGAVVAGC